MKFTPFTKKYTFAKDILIREFPPYMYQPIANWLFKILDNQALLSRTSINPCLDHKFKDQLNIFFREEFPDEWLEVINFVLIDRERTIDFLAFCLQNFVYYSGDADELEKILSQSGSAYEVKEVGKEVYGQYEKKVFNIVERVDTLIKNQSLNAIEFSDNLQHAWNFCYSRNPDYEKVVINCQNFLEKFLRDRYAVSETKPQLGKLIGNLKKNPKFQYKGDTVISDKYVLLILIDKIAEFRGMHTAGTGKIPTKNEAEYILYTSIYFWNLHQK